MDRSSILELTKIYGGSFARPNARNILITCPNMRDHLAKNPMAKGSPTLSVYVTSGNQSVAFCFLCQLRGTLLSCFVSAATKENGGLTDAIAFIQVHDRGNLAAALSEAQAQKHELDDLETAPYELSVYVNKCRHYVPRNLVERGYTKTDFDKWQIGFDAQGWLINRATFPIYDAKKTLVGVTGRTCLPKDKEPNKYKDWPPKFAQRKVDYFYGEQFVDPTVGIVRLVEGPTSTVAASRVLKNVLGTFGAKTGMTPERIRKICKWASKVILLYDGDAPGQNAVHGSFDSQGRWNPGLLEILRPYVSVLVVNLPNGKDPADLPGNQLVELDRSAKYAGFSFLK